MPAVKATVGGLLDAAFGRRDGVAGLRRGRGQRGGEHALRVGGAGDGAEMIAAAAARQRHRGVRNEVAVGILHRHRHRGGRHPVRASPWSGLPPPSTSSPRRCPA